MPLFRFIRTNPGYLPLLVVGTLASLPYTPAQIHGALEVVGVLMLVALFASLLVPFAAFSHPERGYKWVLQNAPLAAFGAYATEVVKEPTLIKMVLMLAAMGMHISYWSSGIHSRAYRLEQFKLGFAAEMPETSKLIACLNGTGRSELADVLVQGILAQALIRESVWDKSFPMELWHLVGPAIKECEEKLSREQIAALFRIKPE